MGLSFWQILLVVVLFLLLFGRGKIPQLMGDVAEGIKSFRTGLSKPEVDTSDAAALPENPVSATQELTSTRAAASDRV